MSRFEAIPMGHVSIAVEESDDFWTPNPGGQEGFMNDYTHRYCALVGGWFSGKTWAGARKLLNLHIHNAFSHDSNPQPTYVKSAVIAPTYQLAQDFDIPHLRDALNEAGLSWRFVSDKTQFKFIIPDLGTRANTSDILVRTADAPDRITGWTVGALWGDEAARWSVDRNEPTHDPFLQADARIRDPKASFLQFMLTFTHEGDSTRVFEDFESNPKRDHVLYRARTGENAYAQDFMKVQQGQLSAELADQYLEGHALSTMGNMVYPSFSRENLDDTLELQDHLPLQISMDFNINPGMHCEIGQFDPSGPLMTTVYQIHAPRMSTIQMLAAFKAFISKIGWRWPRLEVFGDASKDTNAQNGKTNWDIVREWLRENFQQPWVMRIPSNNPSVGDRVNAVNCALRALNGQIKYKIHPRCTHLIADFKQMRWDGNEPSKDDRKRSHASDADGYRAYRQMPIRKVAFSGGKVTTFSQIHPAMGGFNPGMSP